MNKKCMRAVLFIAICIRVLFSAGMPCHAEESVKKTVRIAYYDIGDYYKIKDGAVDSFDVAYLEKMSAYTNYRFEYVDCKTWNNALAMLKNREVDLIGTVQWNQEREDQFEFCLNSYGYTIAEMAALADRGFVYEDYEAIGRATIGCTDNYVRRTEMDTLFAEKNISPIIKTYSTQKQLEDALLSGEIDIIAANSHTIIDGLTILERFNYTPYYFISWKGNTQLTDIMDESILKMQLYEKTYIENLVRKYLPSLLAIPLSKEETDCLANEITYTVYLDLNVKPIIWANSSAEVKGTLVDLCKLIQDKVGIKFEFKPVSEIDNHSAYGETDVTYHTSIYLNSVVENSSVQTGQTGALLNESFSFYHRMGAPYNSGNAYRVAIPKHRDEVGEYLEKEYPNYELITYDTPYECMKSLQENRVDLAFLCDAVVSTSLIEHNYRDIINLPTTSVKFGVGLQFYGKDAALLASIVNKGAQQVTETEKSDIELQYALQIKPDLTLSYIVSEHLPEVALIVLIVTALLMLTGVLTIRNKVIREESKKVEAADRTRSDFYARMSHDMRTPMNGILGMAALSRDETDAAILRENMSKVEESGKYLLGLINDLLDLQRIESGKLPLQYEVVQASKLIESITVMVAATAKKKRINFSVKNYDADFPVYIKCDPQRISQIFVNLLSNAIKFTPEGGTVKVIINRLDCENNILHEKIQVIDTGVGISKEFMKDSLFTAYAQEKNAMTAQYAGSGLGLAITKSLVTLMGGRIEVESKLNEGSVFTVYLDVEMQDKDGAEALIPKENKQKRELFTKLDGRNILICEDHPLNAEIARKLLEKAGCIITWAENGEQGIAKFSAKPEGTFDAILMDIRMPVMDGLTAAKAIREMKRADAATVPIIAMTANAYEEDNKKSLDAGMNAHLAKPIVPQKLYETLANLIK